MPHTVILAAKRSPIGKFLGTLSPLTAPLIGAQVARHALQEVNLPPDAVELAVVGQVVQAGVGQNPARQVALGAGIPDAVTAITVNQVCGSGLQAVMTADLHIRAAEAKIALAGGIESMTNAPHLLRGLRSGGVKFGSGELIDAMQFDGLTCAFENWAMGCAADYTADKYGVSRADQDAFALESHVRAAAARKGGQFRHEIAPVGIPSRGQTIVFDADETIRSDASLDALSKLRPSFDKNGTATAGNASQLADGAAMLLLADADEADRRNLKPRARILSHATFGVAPRDLFIAPVGAIRLALEKAGLKTTDIGLFEINEAFASQMLACIRQLELDSETVNIHGGGIALGHPIGASGARILVTLLNSMEQRKVQRGVAALCLGGGNAVAMVIERC